MQLVAVCFGVGAMMGVLGVWMLRKRRSADTLPWDRDRSRKRQGDAGSDINSDGGDGGGGGD